MNIFITTAPARKTTYYEGKIVFDTKEIVFILTITEENGLVYQSVLLSEESERFYPNRQELIDCILEEYYKLFSNEN